MWEGEDPTEFRLFPLRLGMDVDGWVARPLPELRGRAMENQKRLKQHGVMGMVARNPGEFHPSPSLLDGRKVQTAPKGVQIGFQVLFGSTFPNCFLH